MNVPWKWARENFGKVVDTVHYRGERVVITKFGKPWIDLVPHNNVRAQLTPENSAVVEAPSHPEHAPS